MNFITTQSCHHYHDSKIPHNFKAKIKNELPVRCKFTSPRVKWKVYLISYKSMDGITEVQITSIDLLNTSI